jgi:hypothetical protein
MNFTHFTAPSFKKKQILTTEGNDSTELAEVKGNENQPFVDFVRFCSKFPFVLGAVLLFGLATSVQAQFTYITNNGTITITGYTGSDGTVAIPDVIDGLPVTDIGTSAFQGSSLTSVTIPANVTKIGSSAFEYCPLTNATISLGVTDIESNAFASTDLTSVTIPNSVTNLGDYAFYDCYGLTNVVLDSGLVSIGAYAFSGIASSQNPIPSGTEPWWWQGCPVTSVTIPDSVISLGGYAFYYCSSLTNILVGSGVTNVGELAFGGCPLTAIDVAPGNPAYTSFAGVLFNHDQSTLVEFPRGLGGSYRIPNSVTDIGDYAFYDCTNLTNVVLDDNLTSIGVDAFSGPFVITDFSSLLPIGGYLLPCPLTSITVPANVTNIGDGAFSGCPLTDAYFLGNATDADTYAGWGDSLTAYYLPGTTGWAEFATNTGVPTALWTLTYPLILNRSFRVLNNQFGFTISWATNLPVVVEASTDLSKPVWTRIATNTLGSGTSSFTDPDWTNYPNRFYRIRSQ